MGDSEAALRSRRRGSVRAAAERRYEALVAKLAANPDFARFASEERLRDAELRVAEAHARTNLSRGAPEASCPTTNDEAFVFGVTMPLNASRRARNDIAAARAEREQTTAERDAHRVRAEAELFELFQELRHAITEAEMLRATVLPEMEAALEDTRYAFERGRYSYLEWVDAQRELVDVQRALIDASTNAHLYRTEIERSDRRAAVGRWRIHHEEDHWTAARVRLRARCYATWRSRPRPRARGDSRRRARHQRGERSANGDFTLRLAIFEAGAARGFHAWTTSGRNFAVARRHGLDGRGLRRPSALIASRFSPQRPRVPAQPNSPVQPALVRRQ